MDGTRISTGSAIAKVIERAMADRLSFNTMQVRMYELMKTQGHQLVAVDRIAGQIAVQYYADSSGNILTEMVTELPSYTKAQPVSTW